MHAINRLISLKVFTYKLIIIDWGNPVISRAANFSSSIMNVLKAMTITIKCVRNKSNTELDWLMVSFSIKYCHILIHILCGNNAHPCNSQSYRRRHLFIARRQFLIENALQLQPEAEWCHILHHLSMTKLINIWVRFPLFYRHVNSKIKLFLCFFSAHHCMSIVKNNSFVLLTIKCLYFACCCCCCCLSLQLVFVYKSFIPLICLHPSFIRCCFSIMPIKFVVFSYYCFGCYL